MKTFRFSQRHQILSSCLLTIACLDGQLFSQNEDMELFSVPSPAAEFSLSPPPVRPGADLENIIFFDTPKPTTQIASSNKESEDTGEFSLFPPLVRPGADLENIVFFGITEPAIQTASSEAKPEEQNRPKDIFQEIPQETDSPPPLIETEEREAATLSTGKGNAKVIKRQPDASPATSSQRMEKALLQSDEVVGKAIPHDHEIGMLEGAEEPAEEATTENNSSDKLPKSEEPPSSLPPPPSAPQDIPLLPEEDQEEKEIAQSSNQTGSPFSQINQTAPQNPAQEQQQQAPVATSKKTAIQARSSKNREDAEKVSINFNNVSMIEYIRFISRLSGKNFIFDDMDLQFNVTIISEEPTTIENLMAALLQELRIRDLSLIEQGNNILIHRNPRVRSPARIVSGDQKITEERESELVTRVFRLNTLDPVKASAIIRPLLSEEALIEVLTNSNNLIITDLVTNVNKIAQLIGTLDSPNSGVTIGQYVVRNSFVDSLVELANKILQPIAQGNPFVIVPHPVTNSIYIVSNSFIVEKALAILQNLDLNEGRTKIFSLETLQPGYELPEGYDTSDSTLQGGRRQGGTREGTRGGRDSSERRNGGADQGTDDLEDESQQTDETSKGAAQSSPLGGITAEGRIAPPSQTSPTGFTPGGIGTEGRPSAIFDEARSFLPGGIGASSRWTSDLPVGHIERTMFFIYKLRYRKGDSIEIALRKIANSLQLTGTANADLISAINSSQWIDSSNALIFTGTPPALEKVRELILEVDVPLRQVFIEMLILDTTITDSLSYSVDWINRSGGGTTTAEEGFISAVPGSIASTNQFLSASETIFNSGSVIAPAAASPLPVATGFLNSGGFVAGVIGTHLTHNGTQFSSIGALVRAIHSDIKANIVLNPKIITEDNNPAEIFVGGTDRYKTQSITNDLGSLVTNNFQFIDVGTTLRVTPLIGNNGIITLEILQETTNEATTANTGAQGEDVNLVPVLTKTRTATKIHVPNGFFVILSGMTKDSELRRYSRIPCLGGIPILGCVGKSQSNVADKRNLMIFLRPLILDNENDYEDITKRQQDIFREKSKFRRSWNYEVDEAMSFSNVRPLDPDDMNCQINERQMP